MARFAHFFIKYKHEFAPHHWEDRQRHLGRLFEEDSSIDFRLGEGETQKVFNHRVYHLLSAPEIIVMQFANSIDIPIEDEGCQVFFLGVENNREVEVSFECYIIDG